MLSRVADSLYWMNRYLERAEHTARLVEVNLGLSLDLSTASTDLGWARAARSLGMSDIEEQDPVELAQALAFDPASSSSIIGAIVTARENARQVREQISSEMWEQVNRVFHQVKRYSFDELEDIDPRDFAGSVIAGIHLFQGITDSTMTHGDGWQFLQAGRYMERALNTATLLRSHFLEFGFDEEGKINPADHLHWIALLKSCTAFEAYCKVYTADLQADSIGEFLLLNAEFPHSLHFCADRLHAALEALPEGSWTRKSGKVTRLSGRLRANLGFSQIEEVLEAGVQSYLGAVTEQCAQIHKAIYQVFINYAIEAAVEV